jgi:hypothetical protein
VLFYADDGGKKFLRKVSTHLPGYRSHLARQESSQITSDLMEERINKVGKEKRIAGMKQQGNSQYSDQIMGSITEESGFNSRQARYMYILTCSGDHPAASVYRGLFPRGVKRPGREAVHSPPSSTGRVVLVLN